MSAVPSHVVDRIGQLVERGVAVDLVLGRVEEAGQDHRAVRRVVAREELVRGQAVAARDLVAKLSRSFPDNPGIRTELLELRRKTGAPAGRQP